MEITIRSAIPSDALFLTSISFGAKRYWNYPEEYLKAWHDELTITEDYIERNVVFVAQKKATIIGYCSLTYREEDEWNGEIKLKAGYWLDHIFIRPAYIRNGIGSELIEKLVTYCEENQIQTLNILSDPNANGFYDEIGATYICDVPSNIDGRYVCLFEFTVSPELEESEILQDENIEDERLQERVDDKEIIVETEEENKEQEKVIKVASVSQEEAAENLFEEWEREISMELEMQEDEQQEEIDEIEAEEGELEIFDTFKFKGRGFEAELGNLEQQRMQLEQELLEQKLYELDKDSDEDEVFELDFNEEEYEENEVFEYNSENIFEEEAGSDKYISIEDFEFTASIGYKFQCEEEAEKEINDIQEKLIISETKENEIAEEGQEQLEDIEQDKETEIAEIQEEIEGQNQESIEQDEETELTEEMQEEVESQNQGEIEPDEEAEIAEEIQEEKENHQLEHPYEVEERDIYKIAEAEKAYAVKEITQDIDSTEYMNEEELQEELQHILEKFPEDNDEKTQVLDQATSQEIETSYMRSEKEKMQQGEQYIAWGDEIVEDRRHARRLLKEFNLTDPEDKRKTTNLLKELFGSTGEYIHIEPDFKCNYGYNIHIGDNFYAGYNCVILDNARVSIGDNCIISPQVGIYTLAYPIDTTRRIAGYEYAKPIVIGNNVWIGGGAIINPGVTIGDDVVIAPGSVIISDIPDHVVVGGNPAKIIKEVDE